MVLPQDSYGFWEGELDEEMVSISILHLQLWSCNHHRVSPSLPRRASVSPFSYLVMWTWGHAEAGVCLEDAPHSLARQLSQERLLQSSNLRKARTQKCRLPPPKGNSYGLSNPRCWTSIRACQVALFHTFLFLNISFRFVSFYGYECFSQMYVHAPCECLMSTKPSRGNQIP